MPHDCKGNELQPGNEVILRLRIREISLSEVACNVFADAIDVAGCCEYAPTLSCNSRLFEKVAPRKRSNRRRQRPPRPAPRLLLNPRTHPCPPIPPRPRPAPMIRRPPRPPRPTPDLA